jgi:two-component system, NarL family, nitrate/nitrite response regulator NarL
MTPVILLPNTESLDYLSVWLGELFGQCFIASINPGVLRRWSVIFRLKGLAGRPIHHTMLSMEFAKLRKGRLEATKDESIDGQPGRGRIRLALLDDHLLFRESLARLLAAEHDFELVAECTTSADALKSLKGTRVDVILVDIGIAKDFIPWAQKARYPAKSLVIAREVDATDSAIVLKYGASGIFLASDSASRLMQAIRLVGSGEAWVDQKVLQLLAERYPHFEARWQGKLTAREQSVLQGVVDGLSNRKIGNQMGVSESTIKATLQHLFKKAGVRTRSQLVRIALEGPTQANTTADYERSAAE